MALINTSSDYKYYKVEDFVLDKNFKTWVLRPDRDSNLFWEQWVSQNQHKVSEVKQAREILLRMARLKYTPNAADEDEVWGKIQLEMSRVSGEATNVVPLGPNAILQHYPQKMATTSRSVIYAIAACLALLVCSIAVFYTQTPQASALVITEKSNPRGQKSTVFLPDGSKVYLNSESTLSYDSDYDSKDRIVHLSGEAFFEVAENKLKPFRVVSHDVSTTALGTSFNVNACRRDLIEVSLMTGKVGVSATGNVQHYEELSPGQLVIYSTRDQTLVKGTFEIGEKALWRKRIIYFDDTPFKEAINTLEKWYDVTFTVSGANTSELLCTGKFEDDYLSNVLNSLGYTLGFEYEIKGKKAFLKFQNQKNMPMNRP